MLTYIFTCNKQWGGGMAVVAANDSQEAFNLLKEEYGNDDMVYEYTDLEHCHVNQFLIANVANPTILELNFHVE
jgi:hypothetical protein